MGYLKYFKTQIIKNAHIHNQCAKISSLACKSHRKGLTSQTTHQWFYFTYTPNHKTI